mgnify:CR=1 FL=1
MTRGDSVKVKRIRNNPDVRVAPCTIRADYRVRNLQGVRAFCPMKNERASAQRDSYEILDYAHHRPVEQEEHLSRNNAVMLVTWLNVFVARHKWSVRSIIYAELASPDTIKSLLQAPGRCRGSCAS